MDFLLQQIHSYENVGKGVFITSVNTDRNHSACIIT